MSEPLVSVIISTYNRYKYMLNALNSVLNQTYTNIEVIIVNDYSSQEEYNSFDISDSRIQIIHLNKETNSRAMCGFPSCGYVKTIGMKKASGYYIAFLDDDDVWLPHKLETQIKAMKLTGCKMSCTESLTGKGPYSSDVKYPLYNKERNFKDINAIFRGALSKGFPPIWDYNFIKVHNCIIGSSFIVERELIESVGYKLSIRMGLGRGSEDYDCWLKMFSKGEKCVYIYQPCIFYDEGHGSGRDY
jgi:teichuronic acid biosynthesis glycosyltransferase TuaG